MGAIDTILDEKGHQLHAIGPNASVIEAVEAMCKAHVGALLVMDGSSLLGIFSERDLMTRVLLSRRDPTQTSVASVMTHETVAIAPDTQPYDAMALMTERRVRHLPVLDDAGIAGVISIGDLVRWTIRDQAHELSELRGYVMGAYPG